MNQIRRLTIDELAAFADILVDAYPGWKVSSADERDRLHQRLLTRHEQDPTVAAHGLFRAGKLVGGMLLYDFELNYHGIRIPAGGVGQVAVNLLHKKEHVAREMMRYFLHYYRAQGAPLTLLYPFRPDFYRRMGFGYSAKMSQYRIRPAALPWGSSREHVRYLGEGDQEALLACCNRAVDRTHGMIVRSAQEIDNLLTNPRRRVVGHVQDGHIAGFLVFGFDTTDDFLINDIHVHELTYERPDVLLALTTFLHVQSDQIRHVVIETPDDSFHHLLLDPRNGSPNLIPSVYHETNVQGVGLMVRVVDTRRLFELSAERDLGGQSCRIKLTITDSFLPQNEGSLTLHVERGRLQTLDGAGCDVAVRMDVAEFSALTMGAVDLRSLHRYGLADVSDVAALPTVGRILTGPERPTCTRDF